MTDYDPSSQAPKLNGLSWMTRNLGALSDDYDETGSAKGFVYQWGRKDPFPSGAGWNDLNDITVYDASGTAATDLFANEQVTASNNLPTCRMPSSTPPPSTTAPASATTTTTG